MDIIEWTEPVQLHTLAGSRCCAFEYGVLCVNNKILECIIDGHRFMHEGKGLHAALTSPVTRQLVRQDTYNQRVFWRARAISSPHAAQRVLFLLVAARGFAAGLMPDASTPAFVIRALPPLALCLNHPGALLILRPHLVILDSLY